MVIIPRADQRELFGQNHDSITHAFPEEVARVMMVVAILERPRQAMSQTLGLKT